MIIWFLKNLLFYAGLALLVGILLTLTYFWADPTYGLGLPFEWIRATQNPSLQYQGGQDLFNFCVAWASLTVFCWLPTILFPSMSAWMVWGAVVNRRDFVE
jgi:hypothetical protein